VAKSINGFDICHRPNKNEIPIHLIVGFGGTRMNKQALVKRNMFQYVENPKLRGKIYFIQGCAQIL